MPGALTPPFAVAALVLCVAGVAKLRSPHAAVRALAAAGFVVPSAFVRAFAAFEVGLGCWCLIDPGRVSAAMLAGVYAVFASLSLLLARRRAACGCFGDGDAPATVCHSVLSATLAVVALLAVLWPPHGAGWIVAHHAAVLVLGIIGCAYGTIVAYVELPRAWAAWSPR